MNFRVRLTRLNMSYENKNEIETDWLEIVHAMVFGAIVGFVVAIFGTALLVLDAQYNAVYVDSAPFNAILIVNAVICACCFGTAVCMDQWRKSCQ